MNEDLKNIETCLPEQVGSEIVNAATGDKFDALVTEAWTGKQPAQPYTSWIVEFKSLLILLLHKLYYTPLSMFGNTSIKDFIAGLQATIAAMLADIALSYQAVSNKGGTIPSNPDDRTSAYLPTAIQSIPEGEKVAVGDSVSIEKGISLARLISSSANSDLTKYVDTDYNWEIVNNKFFTTFGETEEITLNCVSFIRTSDQYHRNYSNVFIRNNSSIHTRVLNLPYFVGWYVVPQAPQAYYCCVVSVSNYIREVNMPSFHMFYGHNAYGWDLASNPNLKKVVLGNIDETNTSNTGKYFDSDPKLIHLEFKGVQVSINISGWNPSYVLSDNPTGNDLVTDEGISTNLDQFLQNFREHIALRLAQQPADNPNHLTLTLSQAVFDTIWNADGTPKSTDPDSVIYQINKIIKTDKHWSVNRA